MHTSVRGKASSIHRACNEKPGRATARPPHSLPQRCRKSLRCRAADIPAASTGDGGGGAGSGDGGLKGLGGDGGGEGRGEPKRRGGVWAGWEARCAADNQFVYKVCVEQFIGVTSAVIGDMSSRPYWGLYELDFVFSTLVVGSILNFSLMYVLAPTTAGSVATSGLSRIISGAPLAAYGAPGGHMFEAGGYSLPSRLLTLVYKGGIFAVVGMSAGLVGTAISNGLIAIRQKIDPAFEPQNALPDVRLNAACWALHMGISSNLRQQLINGTEMALQPKMGGAAFRIFSSLLRTGNNCVGGQTFVALAKVMNVQPSTQTSTEIAADVPQ